MVHPYPLLVSLLKNSAIEAVCEVGKDLSLPHPVTDREWRRKFIIPANIWELINIDEDDNFQEDGIKSWGQLLEQNGEHTGVKSLAFVHATGKDIIFILEVVIYGLDYGPSAYVSGNPILVRKLEVVELEIVTKQDDADPIEDF